MRQSSGVRTLAVLVCLVGFCNIIESRTVVKRQAHESYDPSIDPTLQEVDPDDSSRDKRKVDAVYGVKNAVLGFVFNKPKGFAWDVSTTTKRPIKTTTEDIVIFEKNKPVELELPGELFGSSFTLVTNLSTTIGDFMVNSALRAHRLLESMRPFLRGVFGAKGIVIEATTDKPIFSPPNSNSI